MNSSKPITGCTNPTVASRARRVFEKIKSDSTLPSPTGIALEVMEMVKNDTSTVEQLASLVETDPALASRLLKFVNSPLAGLSRQIASVPRAVALLGMQTVKNIALGLSVMNQHPAHCAGFDHNGFCAESVARASTARHVIAKLRSFAPDEAFTCGLLSQVGCLALATAFPEDYARALRRPNAWRAADRAAIERDMLDIDHCALSANLMADWHLPEVFCSAVRFQLTPQDEAIAICPRTQQLALTLRLAGTLAEVFTRPRVLRSSLVSMVNDANRLGNRPDTFHGVFDLIAEEWQDASGAFGITTRKVLPLAELYSTAVDDEHISTQHLA